MPLWTDPLFFKINNNVQIIQSIFAMYLKASFYSFIRELTIHDK